MRHQLIALAYFIVAVLSLMVFPQVLQAAERTLIAIAGDSITAGVGASKGKSWPTQLQGMLGGDYQVNAYGTNGTTLSTKGDKPYVTRGPWKHVLRCNPNVVIIKLGTNDTKSQNIVAADTFASDLMAMIDRLNALPSKPKIYLCLPCFVARTERGSINETDLIEKVIPAIQKVAKEKNLPIIDIHAATKDQPELFPDRVHPNDAGAAVIAKTVFDAIKAEQ